MQTPLVRKRLGPLIVLSILALIGSAISSSRSTAEVSALEKKQGMSLEEEIAKTTRLGFEYLKTKQNADGSWSSPMFPAMTGLVLNAFLYSPEYKHLEEKPDFIQKGLDFILKNVKADGSIAAQALPNYNTAICITTLAAANDPEYYDVIRKGRSYLASIQLDGSESGDGYSVYGGGIGYGSKDEKDHSDLTNTYLALEAIRLTDFVESEDQPDNNDILNKEDTHRLDWEAALKFIERCQNLTASNDQEWASDDPENKGGFVYFPGQSAAGEKTLPDGKVALRSYGSMTYAGLLSFIYADLEKDDARVQAAFDWIKRNYTLEENPGVGQQGLYYYYHTLAKSLTAMEDEWLQTSDSRRIDWKRELTGKLVALQKDGGFWVNDNGRWWENDPILVTSYVLNTLDIIAH